MASPPPKELGAGEHQLRRGDPANARGRGPLRPYLDASALVPVIMSEPSSAAVEGFLATAGGRPMISDFAAAEVSSAISRFVRMGELSTGLARQRLSSFDTWCATDFEAID